MLAELQENSSPYNVFLLSVTIESLVLDPHYRSSIVKMLQTATGTQRRDDDITRIYTWRVVDAVAKRALSAKNHLRLLSQAHP